MDLPRRGRKQKNADKQLAELPLTDAAVPSTADPAAEDSFSGKAVPAKARRGRPPKHLTASEPAKVGDNGAATTSEVEAQTGHAAGPTPEATPVKERRGRKPDSQPNPPAPQGDQVVQASEADAGTPAAAPSAAHWDAATGTVSFDWPAIEQVAMAEGPNQAMSRLLLAARAEGANSRWPF